MDVIKPITNETKPCKKKRAAPTQKGPNFNELKEEIRQIKEMYRQLENHPLRGLSVRWMMKKDGIAVHTTKGKIHEALQKHRHRLKAIITIQRLIRGHFARLYWRKFQHLSSKIAQCVNHTDFYTLEPLTDIEPHYLFFYRGQHEETGSHIYGFHLQSLLIYFAKSRSTHNNQLLNPYNREVMNRRDIQQVLMLTQMFLPHVLDDMRNKPYFKGFVEELGRRSLQNGGPPSNVVVRVHTPPIQNTVRETVLNIPELIFNRITSLPTASPPIVYNEPIVTEEYQREIVEHLAELERIPIFRRIHELFIEFDLLGNYTDARWFMNQTIRGYKVYYIKLQELWNHLPPFVQQSICCVGDPFYLVDVRNIHNQSIETMRAACLKIMEYITHGGINREDQKLGIYQLLIALTYVSRDARQAMYHLL